MNQEEYTNYLNRHYENQNTKNAYLFWYERFSKKFDEVNQDTIDRFLGLYTNNTQTRGFISTLVKCFKIRDIDMPKQRSRPKQRVLKYLTKEQIDILMNQKENIKIAILTRLVFDTGLRLSEMINLNRQNIDLENQRVYGIGKGNKEFDLKFSAKTRRKLYEYLMEDNSERDYPFKDYTVKHPEKQFYHQLNSFCKKLGFRGTPHMIRHGVGHYLRVDKKFDIEQVRQILRHKSIGTTQIYSTADQEEVEARLDNEVFDKEDEEVKDTAVVNKVPEFKLVKETEAIFKAESMFEKEPELEENVKLPESLHAIEEREYHEGDEDKIIHDKNEGDEDAQTEEIYEDTNSEEETDEESLFKMFS